MKTLQTKQKLSIEKPIASLSSSSTLCETSNIRFGKLDILLQSYNSVPTFQSFYDNTSLVASDQTKSIHIEEPYNCKKKDTLKSESITQTQVSIVPSLQISMNLDEPLPETNVICWWCCIVSIPVEYACFLPIKYDELRKRYTKQGYFCCWECTKAFNFDIRDIKGGYRSYMIHNICRSLYGIKYAHTIKYAPHWTILKRYGGDTNDDKFFDKKQRTTLVMIDRTRLSIM